MDLGRVTSLVYLGPPSHTGKALARSCVSQWVVVDFESCGL